MKKHVLTIAVFIAAVMFLTIDFADAQWRSDTHDVYNAPTGVDVTIDGKLDEWVDVKNSVTGTDGEPFCGIPFENIGTFQEYGGGTWSGADDHTTCFMIVWNADAVYLALEIIDDEHEHAAGQAWNGDGAQIAIEPSGDRTANLPLFLYNAGLRDTGDLLLQNERTNNLPGLTAGEDFAVTRDDGANKTYYEFRVTTDKVGLTGSFTAGIEFGLGICVNDGDLGAGQNGQKGWSGWYPHAVVFGKNSEKTGLVVLSDTAVTPVEPNGKLTTTWGTMKSSR